MNKLFLIVFLLVSSVLNLQASEQRYTYEFNCNNREYITRCFHNGKEEKIFLQDGQSPREKIRELRKDDEMCKKQRAQASVNKAESAKYEKKNFTTAIFTGSSHSDEEQANSSGMPSIYFSQEKIEEMVNGPINIHTIKDMTALMGQSLDRFDRKK
jgi:hypothetical protein